MGLLKQGATGTEPCPIWTLDKKKQCVQSALKIGFEKESDWNQISLQSECNLRTPASAMMGHSEHEQVVETSQRRF